MMEMAMGAGNATPGLHFFFPFRILYIFLGDSPDEPFTTDLFVSQDINSLLSPLHS